MQDMSLSSQTSTRSTLTSRELFLSAPLRPMWEAVSAGAVYTGLVPTWLVDTELNCRSCDDVTTARCTVATWTEFDRQLRQGAFKCGCGGDLTQESALIKMPVGTGKVGALTKSV